MKKDNEKDIKLPKNRDTLSTQIEKKHQKDSYQNYSKLKEEDDKNMKNIKINEQNNSNIISLSHNNIQKKNNNLFNDDFFIFLNEIIFNSKSLVLNREEQNILKKYHSELKNSKNNSLKKLHIFYDIKLLPILSDRKTDIKSKVSFESRKKEIENFLKSLDKKDIFNQKDNNIFPNNNIKNRISSKIDNINYDFENSGENSIGC